MNDVVEVTQLVLHERQARDRGWWEPMRACFASTATVRLSWFRGSAADFVTASERMVESGDRAAHRLGPPVVDIHGARAVVELPAAIELRAELDGVEVDLTSYARLVYRAARHEGRWLIESFDPVYERDTLVPSHPGARLELDPAELTGLRPAYRLLGHLLGRRGYRIADDLYGDDRPEPVAAFYRETFAWLRA
ncbi:nuclear transport factor 2 family protein [Kitasatospora sp. NPDC008050]|uniref:nuclear transport factor 2 family protein n=1 Tax=Kitasatospora sp. NPDC008050 TaxID=3364021 RepID=UPI0036E2BDF6